MNELQSWKDNNVFEVVSASGQDVMGTRWVLTMKKDASGKQVPKARLVVKGFCETLDTFEEDSPVVSREAMKMCLALAAMLGWPVLALDVKTAFLHGKHLTREICVEPPSESGTPNGTVWRLKNQFMGCRTQLDTGI